MAKANDANDDFAVRSLGPRRVIECDVRGVETKPETSTAAAYTARLPNPKGRSATRKVGGAFGKRHEGPSRPPQLTAKKKNADVPRHLRRYVSAQRFTVIEPSEATPESAVDLWKRWSDET